MEWNESRQRWENGRSKVVTAAREQGRNDELIDWGSPEAVATNPHWSPELEELEDLMQQAPGNFDPDPYEVVKEESLSIQEWVDQAAHAA